MSPLALRLTKPQTRSFSHSPPNPASILFALGALSNSRETQHFNKISRLERFEHSPNLKLIKTSEIDPFPVPIERLLQNPPSHTAAPSPPRTAFRRSQDVGRSWDQKALLAGRAILHQTAAERSRLSRTISRLRRRETRQNVAVQRELASFQKERLKMREEMRNAGFLILLAVGAATGLGLWTFWPAGRDSGELGRKIAEQARGSIPLPSVSGASAVPTVASPAVQDGAVAAGAGAVPTAAVVTGESTVAPAILLEDTIRPAAERTWRSLFWKKS